MLLKVKISFIDEFGLMNKKVKTKVNSILFIMLLLVSNSAFAKIYKCTTDGKLVYQSEPCPIIESENNTQHFFGFDSWKFGTSIHLMKQKARERQLAISPGTSVLIQSFNEKLLNQRPKARKYTYRTKIMEKLTTVTLFFRGANLPFILLGTNRVAGIAGRANLATAAGIGSYDLTSISLCVNHYL